MTLPDGTVIPRQERKCDVEFGQTTKWDGDQLIVISAFWDAKLQRQQIGQFCAARSITPTRTAWLHIEASLRQELPRIFWSTSGLRTSQSSRS